MENINQRKKSWVEYFLKGEDDVCPHCGKKRKGKKRKLFWNFITQPPDIYPSEIDGIEEDREEELKAEENQFGIKAKAKKKKEYPKGFIPAKGKRTQITGKRLKEIEAKVRRAKESRENAKKLGDKVRNLKDDIKHTMAHGSKEDNYALATAFEDWDVSPAQRGTEAVMAGHHNPNVTWGKGRNALRTYTGQKQTPPARVEVAGDDETIKPDKKRGHYWSHTIAHENKAEEDVKICPHCQENTRIDYDLGSFGGKYPFCKNCGYQFDTKRRGTDKAEENQFGAWGQRGLGDGSGTGAIQGSGDTHLISPTKQKELDKLMAGARYMPRSVARKKP